MRTSNFDSKIISLKSTLYLLSILGTTLSIAQKRDSTLTSSVYNLEEVTVIGSRINIDDKLTPFAISKIDSGLINQPIQQLSIKEQLLQVPGVYVQNAYNFAQDARISIRGFGANAPFGIRGIKLIIDGIPETTPDGTGQLDNLNLDQIGSIEVIRGASSSLYGNASGGTILINSSVVKKDFLTLQSMGGSYGFHSQALSGGLRKDKSNYQANVRYFRSNGYRDHNTVEQINARFASTQQFSDKLSANFILEYVHSPEAQDAGGLTIEETMEKFSQARDRNILFDAGESVTQWKVGSSLRWQISEKSNLNTYAFYNRRLFDGRLPFENSAMIDLERDHLGFGNSIDVIEGIHSLKAGYDLFSQIDNRLRFNNLNGIQGDLVFDQEESFLNAGFYILDQIEWSEWFFSTGLRYDLNRLEVEDRFIADGDDSGLINMNNWSYHIGVGRAITSSLQLFVNHATSFETPSLAQLSSRPDNSGGFENLKAATARNYEAGLRWRDNQFGFEIVGFFTQTKNELVSYELEEFPGRDFFRNSGKTSRKGLEFASSYQNSLVAIHASYTLTNFTFKDYVENGINLEGFRLPGIPNHFASVNFTVLALKDLTFSIPVQYVDLLWVDNENTVSTDDYIEMSLMTSYQLQFNKLSINPFFGIRNLTNQRYFDNIRINAFGGRHYEPAPGRNLYGGIKVRI